MILSVEEGVRRAIAADSMVYNRKQHTPDDQRDAELRFLYELALMAPDGPAVECGVKKGGSLLCWSCARLGRGEIIGVDNWLSGPQTLKQRFLENMAAFNLDVHLITADACDAPALIKGQVAFCFIDACHDETGISQDILVWPDKIMPGGILAFHDYGVWKPTVAVKRFVDHWHEQAQWEPVNDLVGSTIAFRKPAAHPKETHDP